MKDAFVARLGREIEAWVGEGLLTREQAQRIAARYRVEGAPSRLIGIITLIGAALIASGLGLVIAHNWERLSDWTKIIGLVALLAGFYAAGYELRDRGYARTGDALLMVGAALFLCGIALVSQIFHLNARPPNGVLLWLAGIVPLAYMLRSGPVLFVGLLGAITWIGMETGSSDSLLFLGGRQRGFDPLGALFGNWVALMGLTTATGAALVGGGALHRDGLGKFERVFDLLGILLFGGGLYALTFLRHDYVPKETWRDEMFSVAVRPVLLFAVLGIVLAALAWRSYPPTPARTRAQHAGSLALGCLFAFAPVAAWPLGLRGTGFDEVYSFLCGVYLLAASIALIAAGARWGRPGWINLGLLFVGLNIVTRYFDLVGTRLQGGMLFITGGALILAIGIVLEKQRRRLLRRMEAA